ncbi:MAG: GAF domain-containing protein [Candidatus Riflebacteria bacterium]|nr:GAF domain-containing protein [Candidatus Riflebacteria bacterium]
MFNYSPETALLLSLFRIFLKEEDIEQIVEAAFKHILQAAKWDYGELWEWAPALNLLVLKSVEHSDNPALTEFARQSRIVRLAMGEGLSGRVFQDKTAIWEEDITTLSEHLFPRVKLAQIAGLRGALGIPVIISDRVAFVMIFFLSPLQAADSKAVEMVSMVGMQLEMPIHCLQTRMTLEKANHSFSRTLEIQTAINKLTTLPLKNQSFDTTLHDFLEIIIELPWLSITRKGCLFLVDETTGHLVMRTHCGLNQEIVEACSIIPSGKCLCGRVLESGKAIFRSCVDDEHEISYSGMAEHGHYCSPLKSGNGKIIGVLNFYVKHGHVSEPWEVQFLDTVSNLLAQIIEKENVQEQKRRTDRQLMHLQREESIGRLASGIAHDFNNLLAVILGYTEMTFDSLPEDFVAREDLSEVLIACQRARSLTRQLLLFSRNDVVEKVKLDLNEVAKNLSKMLGRLIGEQVQLEVITSDESTCIIGDHGQMEQLILNLTINARDAMPMGGRIIIKTGKVIHDETVFDSLAGKHIGAFAYLTVTDTGTGMPPEVLKRIFEPFFTTKATGAGTGLGLATAKQIVDQHDGQISVQSQLQVGTQFAVRFPLAEGTGKLYVPGSELVVKRGVGQRILVLEDENILQELAIKVLSKGGYSVSGASCPSDALRYLSEKDCDCPFDLVFSDLVMPEISGLKLLDFLCESFRGAKVLITTGYIIQEPDFLDQLKKSKIPLLHKPYSVHELLIAVSQALE